jgi:hypothetical protein
VALARHSYFVSDSSLASRSATISRVIRSFSIWVLP